MLVAVIEENSLHAILESVTRFQENVDVFELRLDCLSEKFFKDLNTIKNKINKPIILTLRPPEQGGFYQGTERERLKTLMALAELNPEYIDIESSVSDQWISDFHLCFPNIKIIRSYHDFKQTPVNLDEIVLSMQHPDVSVYKLVGFANSTLDTLLMLQFVKRSAKNISLVAHCMGTLGVPSRVVGNMLGNYFTYASLGNIDSSVSGILDVDTLINIYQINKQNKDTAIYALIGCPVEHSMGHLFHNQQFLHDDINACYVKLAITKTELQRFFELIRDLPFKGLSVTMPLKEAVLSYMTSLDQRSKIMGAVNTVLIKQDKLYATNTDGLGALDAIEKIRALDNAHILILGAGGTAKAIVYELRTRNIASITMLNRTLSKAETIAYQYGGEAYDFQSFQQEKNKFYDIVINTIPVRCENNEVIFLLIESVVSSNTVVMNVDYSAKESILLEKLRSLEGGVIDGTAMFIHQAVHQQAFWQSLIK